MHVFLKVAKSHNKPNPGTNEMTDLTSAEAHHPERIVPHWFATNVTLKRIVNIFEGSERALIPTLVVVATLAASLMLVSLAIVDSGPTPWQAHRLQ
jgi:hypothetical protein